MNIMDGCFEVMNKKNVRVFLGFFKWAHPKKTCGFFWVRTRVSEP